MQYGAVGACSRNAVIKETEHLNLTVEPSWFHLSKWNMILNDKCKFTDI